MTIHLIPIDQIDSNPYQTREREDPEHVKRVSDSIHDVGLLQEPLARLNGHDRYQLAYGHTRVAAYRKLNESGELGYDLMPLKLADLSDLQMFELAVRENSERKDLTPIEEARAMKVYRDQFGKSSEEIGLLFGLQASTVRNKLRLLELPEAVQERVELGQLSEGTARTLLTVQKVAPDQVTELGQDLAEGSYENPESVSKAVKDRLRDQPNTLEMWGAYKKEGKPSAGTGLWALDWDPDLYIPITAGQFKKIFPKYEKSQSLAKNLNDLSVEFEFQLKENLDVSELVERYFLTSEFVGQARQMMRPPACTQCPYYVRLDGSHWCGLKQCYARKKKAWIEAETQRLSEELGIPIYDKDQDGKDYEECNYWGDNPQWEGWFAERVDHLRLKGKLKDWSHHNLTESYTTMLVSVRAEYQAAQEKSRQAKAEREVDQNTTRNQWKIDAENRERSDAFLWEVAGQVFAVAFAELSKAVVPDLAAALTVKARRDDLPEDTKERMAFYRRCIAYAVLDVNLDWDTQTLGPEHVAGHLRGVAITWGVPLPDDWDDIAEQYAKGVSMETAPEGV